MRPSPSPGPIRIKIPNPDKRVCVLVSGGVDSSVLAAEMLERGYEVHPLYVRSGFYWEKAELHWLKALLRAFRGPRLKALTVAEVPMAWVLGRHWSFSGRGVPQASSPDESVYLCGRNLVLLGQGGIFCATRGIPLLALAALKGNPFPDAKPRFLRLMGAALKAALGSGVRILTPYSRLSKAQVARRIKGFPARLTFSCLKPGGLRHCGVCNKCEERRAGLEAISRAPRS